MIERAFAPTAPTYRMRRCSTPPFIPKPHYKRSCIHSTCWRRCSALLKLLVFVRSFTRRTQPMMTRSRARGHWPRHLACFVFDRALPQLHARMVFVRSITRRTQPMMSSRWLRHPALLLVVIMTRTYRVACTDSPFA
jgi:hypothetical protein